MMKALSPCALADLSFDITWEKDGIAHQEHYFADQFNCWRDIVPDPLLKHIRNGSMEDPVSLQAKPGELVPEYRPDNVHYIPKSRLDIFLAGDGLVRGRFYPQGMISGIPGIFKGNITPFRCVDIDGDSIRADLNHPMAGIPMDVTLRVHSKLFRSEERGGCCTDWIELALSGPGMQARYNRQPTDFFLKKFFDRRDPRRDPRYYARDRFVQHIDDTARQNLSDLYETILRPGDAVLDLMAGWESHIPGELDLSSLHGLGLNANELKGNKQLTAHTVQDLNTNGRLAFGDACFDAVICSLSVEYLINPVAVFKEVARVLKPGGVFAVTFSNRWFPEKAIRIWEELHDFERVGLVTEYFLESGRYESVSTVSMRGYPRPYGDKYFPAIMSSDPVHCVIGRKFTVAAP
ncbi:MAG: methyltransferase domain-containing protein [Desulfobacteraceae bacterium]|nr:methyltransferase domain-containing protein [Desulfobacteraceae bacterium]